MGIILKVWYVLFWLFTGWSVATYLKGFKMLVRVKNYGAIAGKIVGILALALLFAPVMYITAAYIWGR